MAHDGFHDYTFCTDAWELTFSPSHKWYRNLCSIIIIFDFFFSSSSSSFPFPFLFLLLLLLPLASTFDLGFPHGRCTFWQPSWASQHYHFFRLKLSALCWTSQWGTRLQFQVMLPIGGWQMIKESSLPPYSGTLFVWLLCWDLSCWGDPTSSYTTGSIAPRLTGACSPLCLV